MAEPSLLAKDRDDGAVTPLQGFLQDVRSALGMGDSAAARALIDAPANPRWRLRPAVRVLHVRLLLLEDRAAEAEAECLGLMAEAPEGVTGHLPLLCRALIQQDRIPEARESFAAHVWAGPFSPEVRGRLMGDLTATGTAEALAAFTARLHALRAPTTAEHSRMAAAEVRTGQHAQAIARLMDLERSGPLTILQKTQLLQALQQLGRVEEALRRVLAWQAEDPENPTWVLQEVRVLNGARRDDVAIDCALTGLDRWPLHEGLLRQLAQLPVPADDCARVLDRLIVARGTTPLAAGAAMGAALTALHARRTDLAVDLLTDVAAGADLRAVLLHYPPAFWTGAARFRNDPLAPVQVVRRPGARATVVVFPGINRKLGSLPLDYVDALLSRHPVQVIYLQDRLRSGFLAPAPEVGGSAAGLVAQVQALAAELGGQPLIALGHSVGAYAAMLHGPAMGMAGILAYSGPTALYSAQDRPAEIAQESGLAFLARIPRAKRDVVPGLAARPDLPVWHIAGARHAKDLLHQQRLAGLPQVRRLQMEGIELHNTLLPAVLRGQFDALLGEAIDRAG